MQFVKLPRTVLLLDVELWPMHHLDWNSLGSRGRDSLRFHATSLTPGPEEPTNPVRSMLRLHPTPESNSVVVYVRPLIRPRTLIVTRIKTRQ